jgi:hypothetical protein
VYGTPVAPPTGLPTTLIIQRDGDQHFLTIKEKLRAAGGEIRYVSNLGFALRRCLYCIDGFTSFGVESHDHETGGFSPGATGSHRPIVQPLKPCILFAIGRWTSR